MSRIMTASDMVECYNLYRTYIDEGVVAEKIGFNRQSVKRLINEIQSVLSDSFLIDSVRSLCSG